MQGEFFVPVYFDYFATFAWAFSGAVVGVRRGYDIVGVFLVALVSSTGGGLIRDGFMLQKTPALLTNSVYLVLIAVATVLVGLVSKWLVSVLEQGWLDKFIELIDAIGMPAFAIVGMQKALEQEISIPGVILVGVINGVGGGLLRDVLEREPAPSAAGPVFIVGPFDRMYDIFRTPVWTGRDILGALVWTGPERNAGRVRHDYAVLRRACIDLRFNWTSGALLREPRK